MMRKLILVVVGFFFFGVISARANDIYIAQSGTGAASGADCADARGYTSLGSGDWVAGNTIHLCGTFSMPDGASGIITIGGSGAAGNPITVKFETGANATASYWGGNGFIYASGKSYIVVDGGTNGSITATANGTNLTYKSTPSTGVYFYGVSNSEIKNLSISNIYVHACTPPLSTCTDEVGTQTTWGIYLANGSNLSVDNNTVHDAYACVQYVWNTANSNISIFNNNLYDCNWSANVGSGSTGATLGHVVIYGNQMHDWGNWDDVNNQNHHDGIFLFSDGAGANITGAQIYNNLLYGNIQAGMTAYIYASGYGQISGTYMFNNVMYNVSSGYADDGYLYDYENGSYIFNNTIVGRAASGTGGNGYITYATGSTLRNNIITTCASALAATSTAGISSSDYNDLYGCADVANISGTYYTTLASWQASSGSPDAHSTNGNPLLNASSTPPYQLGSTSSSAYQTGTNLTSYCSTVPALCTDAAGNARPSSGAWDIGAYQYSTGGKSGAPNPPTGLTAVVN